MINYIIQVLLFQALFLTVYDLFLQKETFFKWNRAYLILTPILSFIIPSLKFETIQESVPEAFITQMPEVFINPQAVIEMTVESKAQIDYFELFFFVGMGLFAVLFLVRLYKITKLILSNKVIKKTNYSLVVLNDQNSAFSFFKYIFINNRLKEKKELQIIQHELVHCKQLHSADLLFFELLKIVLWFNPLIYVYQKRITLLHEYISDAETVKETDKKTYFEKLLSETFSVEHISFVNQFFNHSLIKKRIVMITKNKSSKIKQLRYLLIIPVFIGMLVYTACTDAAKDEILEMEALFRSNNKDLEGSYLDLKSGKTFVGSELNGVVVPFEEYTDKEKDLHSKLSAIENSIFEYMVMLDMNGERVHFIKTTKDTEAYKAAKKYLPGEDVPFAIIEDVPIYPGCEGSSEELKKCLQEKITMHVNRTFNASLSKNLGLSAGTKRIFVMFKIDKDGNISEIKSRAPHPDLQEEAIRVVKALPQMKPGKHNGIEVGVKYSLPIAFRVEGGTTDSANENMKNDIVNTNGSLALALHEAVLNDKNVKYSKLNNGDSFADCTQTNFDELKKCYSDKVASYIYHNFDANLLRNIGNEKETQRIFVLFNIGVDGSVSKVRTRAKHPSWAAEAKRVLQSLPNLNKGIDRERLRDMTYSLPISVKVN